MGVKKRAEEGRVESGDWARVGRAYVPLVLVLLLALPVLAAGGRDFAMYAPIRNAMPTTNETMARIAWWPWWTEPDMKCNEFAAPETYKIPAMIARIPITARMITSGPRFADPLGALAELTCSS